MPKFSNKVKKPDFCLFLTHFPHFLGKKIFFKKSGSVRYNNTWAPNIMLSFRKKLMSRCQENFQTEGQNNGRTDRP